MTDVKQVSIRVDSADAERKLNALAGAGKSAGAGMRQVGEAAETADAAVKGVASGTQRAGAGARNMASGVRRAGSATQNMAAQARAATGSLSSMGAAMRRNNAHGQALTRTSSTAGFATANLAAQFNDIGVMLASGQSPLLLAVQQGTQVNQVMTQMRATGQSTGRALLSAFTSIISPMSILTIGAIAGGAALVQWGLGAIGAMNETKSLEDALEDLEDAFSDYTSATDNAVSSLEDLTEKFGPAASEAKRLLDNLRALAAVDLQEKFDAMPDTLIGQGRSGWFGFLTSDRGALESLFDIAGAREEARDRSQRALLAAAGRRGRDRHMQGVAQSRTPMAMAWARRGPMPAETLIDLDMDMLETLLAGYRESAGDLEAQVALMERITSQVRHLAELRDGTNKTERGIIAALEEQHLKMLETLQLQEKTTATDDKAAKAAQRTAEWVEKKLATMRSETQVAQSIANFGKDHAATDHERYEHRRRMLDLQIEERGLTARQAADLRWEHERTIELEQLAKNRLHWEQATAEEERKRAEAQRRDLIARKRREDEMHRLYRAAAQARKEEKERAEQSNRTVLAMREQANLALAVAEHGADSAEAWEKREGIQRRALELSIRDNRISDENADSMRAALDDRLRGERITREKLAAEKEAVKALRAQEAAQKRMRRDYERLVAQTQRRLQAEVSITRGLRNRIAMSRAVLTHGRDSAQVLKVQRNIQRELLEMELSRAEITGTAATNILAMHEHAADLDDAIRDAEPALQRLNTIVDDISTAWAEWVVRGFRDFRSFTDSVKETFRRLLVDMVATAARNAIFIPIAAGVVGGVGGALGVGRGGSGGGGGGFGALDALSFAGTGADFLGIDIASELGLSGIGDSIRSGISGFFAPSLSSTVAAAPAGLTWGAPLASGAVPSGGAIGASAGASAGFASIAVPVAAIAAAAFIASRAFRDKDYPGAGARLAVRDGRLVQTGAWELDGGNINAVRQGASRFATAINNLAEQYELELVALKARDLGTRHIQISSGRFLTDRPYLPGAGGWASAGAAINAWLRAGGLRGETELESQFLRLSTYKNVEQNIQAARAILEAIDPTEPLTASEQATKAITDHFKLLTEKLNEMGAAAESSAKTSGLEKAQARVDTLRKQMEEAEGLTAGGPSEYVRKQTEAVRIANELAKAEKQLTYARQRARDAAANPPGNVFADTLEQLQAAEQKRLDAVRTEERRQATIQAAQAGDAARQAIESALSGVVSSAEAAAQRAAALTFNPSRIYAPAALEGATSPLDQFRRAAAVERAGARRATGRSSAAAARARAQAARAAREAAQAATFRSTLTSSLTSDQVRLRTSVAAAEADLSMARTTERVGRYTSLSPTETARRLAETAQAQSAVTAAQDAYNESLSENQRNLQDAATAAQRYSEAAAGAARAASSSAAAYARVAEAHRDFSAFLWQIRHLGLTFDVSAEASQRYAQTIVGMFDGIDEFTARTAAYYKNFFSEAERRRNIEADLALDFDHLGLAMPRTRQQFRDLVEAQDLATDAGQKTFAALIDIAGQFATLTEESRSLQDALRGQQGLFRTLAREIFVTSAPGLRDLQPADDTNTLLRELIRLTQMGDINAARQRADMLDEQRRERYQPVRQAVVN